MIYGTAPRLGSCRLEERRFGNVTNKQSLVERKDVLERLPLEMMKLMEMYDFKDGEYVDHWAEKPLGTMYDARWNFTPQEIPALVLPTTFDEVIRIYGANGCELLKKRYKNPDGFINEIRDRMLTESAGENSNGEPKYEEWFRVHKLKVRNKDFIRFIKTLSLCLSGQLSPEDVKENYWDPQLFNFVRTTKVDYKVNIFRTLPKAMYLDLIHKIILSVISGYSQIDFVGE